MDQVTARRRALAAMRKVAHDPGDPQITSHCPFCGSGQIVGRSDSNIECEFCGMVYLVRVQPMFTGMPGNPMGGGFGGDTSMAPDMMAPEMLGPDGEPMMGEDVPPEMLDPSLMGEEGMPGEGEGEPEEGDEEDEEGDGPPWAGSGGDDSGEPAKESGGEKSSKEKGSSGKKNGPPPKNKKKSAVQVQVQRNRQSQRSRFGGDEEIPGSAGGTCSCKGCGGHSRRCQTSVLRAGTECYSCQAQNRVKAEACYRTVAGDELPEEAYIRHLAVLHGGVEVVRRVS